VKDAVHVGAGVHIVDEVGYGIGRRRRRQRDIDVPEVGKEPVSGSGRRGLAGKGAGDGEQRQVKKIFIKHGTFS
jgi:hypothetical protein